MTRLHFPGLKFRGKENPGKSKRDCAEAVATAMIEELADLVQKD
jgi:hypothetical protein